jgi:alkyldihydroxyacetonephosphate synthase
MEEPDRIAQELEEVLPGRVTRDVAAYLKDWWPLLWITDEVAGSAAAAVKPVNVDELVKLVKFASSRHVSLYIHGGGSSVTGASIPSNGVVVDMGGMDQLLDVDEANWTVTAQAGETLKDLESRLNKKGFTLSQFPQSFELATVGGFISTMGTGQYSSLYGGIEESVLRLEVVLPSGEVVWTRNRGAPRSAVGPDISRLFLGAEGSLGVISAAELKMRRLPKHVWKAAYKFQSFQSATGASKRLLELDVKPAVCRVYNEVESMFTFEDQSCVLLLVYHFDSETVLNEIKTEVSDLLKQDSMLADAALVDRWLEKRFNFREEIDNVKRMGFIPETVEVAAKWSRILELYQDVIQTVNDLPGVAGVGAHISHLYDQGACIYFTILLEPRKEVYSSIWDAMAKITRNHDATISHHHGVGILKRVYASDEVPIGLMKKIKQAVDPEGILNPDRFP